MNRNLISDLEWIDKKDINEFGSYEDRKNSYDDEEDVNAFVSFLKLIYTNEYTFKSKPFGPYGVDLGVYKKDKLVFIADIERWSKWNEDWPQNYRYVSFLSRKLKFVHKNKNFVMVFFNYNRTKFICVNGEDILKYPSGGRYTQGKMDSVIKVPFDDARMYGPELTEREMSLFKKHKVIEIK